MLRLMSGPRGFNCWISFDRYSVVRTVYLSPISQRPTITQFKKARARTSVISRRILVLFNGFAASFFVCLNIR